MGFPHTDELPNEKEDFTARKARSLSDIVNVTKTTESDLNIGNTPNHEDCVRKALEYFEWNCSPVDYQQSEYYVLLMSPHKELYDGFCGPWSWETTSLQEMGFPPTPELEPKSNDNHNKKMKRKKNLTVTGEEEINDLRTYETLEELQTRLKANYIEAKEQREKYLNLKCEQSVEEKRAKSLKGNRDQLKGNRENKNKKNVTVKSKVELPRNMRSSFRSNRDQSTPHIVKTLDNNGLSVHDSFHNELANALSKSISNAALSNPDSSNPPGLNIINNSISPELIPRDSPRKPLLNNSSSSDLATIPTIRTTGNKNESFQLVVTDTKSSVHPIETNDKHILKSNSNHSNISTLESPSTELKHKHMKRNKSKNIANSVEGEVHGRASSNSRENSFRKEDMEKKEVKKSTEAITPFVDSHTEEETANESVIQNENTDTETSMGLGNVMDMLSNW